MSKRIYHKKAKLSLTSFLLENSKYTLPALGTPFNFIYTKLMQILRMLLERPLQKISYWKAHLETVICCILASRLKFIRQIRAK